VLAGLVKARREGSIGATAPAPARALAETSPKPLEPSVIIAPAAGSAVDPVCGMSVDIATAELRTEHAGKSYYFCCAGCQHAFEKAPEKYLSGATA
jgi:YHS domain-containing protein